MIQSIAIPKSLADLMQGGSRVDANSVASAGLSVETARVLLQQIELDQVGGRSLRPALPADEYVPKLVAISYLDTDEQGVRHYSPDNGRPLGTVGKSLLGEARRTQAVCVAVCQVRMTKYLLAAAKDSELTEVLLPVRREAFAAAYSIAALRQELSTLEEVIDVSMFVDGFHRDFPEVAKTLLRSVLEQFPGDVRAGMAQHWQSAVAALP